MNRRCGTARIALLGLAASWFAVACPVARAQTAVPPDHAAGGVIHPPTQVDPKMTVAPPRAVRMPTPVVHPPAPQGTVVVPK